MIKKCCVLLALLLLMTALASCKGKTQAPDPSSCPTEASDAEQTKDSAEDVQQTKGNGEDVQQTKNGEDETQEAPKEAKEFTAEVRLEDDFVSFRLPEDHDGGSFTDLGASCVIMFDRYSSDVAAYHEYDNAAAIEKKTAGNHTFDYQKFNNMNIPNWKMYVLRIENGYGCYRFIYNVYSEEYDDAQVEKFMETIRFANEE